MAIDNVPLFFGFNHEKAIGRVSIFDEDVIQRFMNELELVRKGRFQDTTRYLLSWYAKTEPKSEILSFAFVPDPMPALRIPQKEQ